MNALKTLPTVTIDFKFWLEDKTDNVYLLYYIYS